MMYTKKDLYDILKNQLSTEYNCQPSDFDKSENILTDVKLNDNRRHFSENGHFFQMVTLGGNAVISADVSVHKQLSEFIKDKTGHWLFEHSHLLEIEEILRPHGKTLWQSHHMFLPDMKIIPTDEIYPVRWFETDGIHAFYDGGNFPNALCESFNPLRPDILAAAAYDDEKIIGMAGCSADTPILWQIGIDVDEAYRGRGIGTYLVRLLKNEVIQRGKIPYYGTSLSNLHSWNIALNSGFYPAWVEIETK